MTLFSTGQSYFLQLREPILFTQRIYYTFFYFYTLMDVYFLYSATVSAAYRAVYDLTIKSLLYLSIHLKNSHLGVFNSSLRPSAGSLVPSNPNAEEREDDCGPQWVEIPKE